METIPCDVAIVGAGPAGLAAAIRLRQRAQADARELSVVVLEKGAEVGAHILSGAVIDPGPLFELFPNALEAGAPLDTPAQADRFLFLTRSRALKLPTPPGMRNHGNYIVRLGQLCQWLASQAEALGVQIFPGFAAESLRLENGCTTGIVTGAFGIGKNGERKANYQPGVVIEAKYTLLAEGCRGSISEEIMRTYHLREACDPQTYGIGLKELWEIPDAAHRAGEVVHTVGWPLDAHTYGGAFLYHLKPNLIAVGLVAGLDYRNPYLDPFQELQRFKTHPAIRPLFEGGKRIAYGARALNEGGLQSIPGLVFPGGAMIGCAAGFMNVPRIKGTHTAMKSGMLAADAAFDALSAAEPPALLSAYPETLKRSWVWDELSRARNIRPVFRHGLWAGLAHAALDTFVLRGRAPWTFHHHPDHATLTPARHARPIAYPKPDGTLTFDKLSSLYLSGTNHEEDQPCHLRLKDPEVAITHNLALYDAPEQRYCPANVYEIVREEHAAPRLQINAQNCLHCKTCDIKDPTQNICWTVPEAGGGPRYSGM